MNTLLTAAALLFAGLAIWCLIRHNVGHNVPALPGTVPFLGHTFAILRSIDRILDWQLAACRQMNFRTFYFTMQATTYYMVTDPTCLEFIHKTHSDSFIKGALCSKKLAYLLGDGIMNSEGEQWFWQHKLAKNIWSENVFKQYIHEVFLAKYYSLADRLSQSSADGTPVDLQHLIHCLTLDALCEGALAVNPGALTSRQQVPIAAALDRIQMFVNRRLLLPRWPLVELLDGSHCQLARDSTALRQFAAQAIQKRRHLKANRDSLDNHQAMGRQPCDMLSLLMDATGPGGQPLSDSQLVDTVLNFLVAGAGTIAQAISGTICQLLQHPDCEGQLVKELQEVLGDKPGSYSGLTCDQYKQVKYTRACFREAMRLNPPVPLGVRYAAERQELPDGSVIPKGAQIMYNIFCINRMTSFWGPTAELYRPERWLDMDTVPSPYSYMTFSAGPRCCLGQQLAELEGVSVLAGLLGRFKFTQVAPRQRAACQGASTMLQGRGLRVYVKKRDL